MNGAQWVVHALRAQGVNTVFGYPGGAIMPVYDALYDGGMEHLLCRHEQGCGNGGYRLCPCYWQNWRMYRHVWSGRNQPDNRACGRTVRFHPRCCYHRSGIRTVYRH